MVSLHPSMSDPRIPVLPTGKVGFRAIEGPAEELQLGSDLILEANFTWLEGQMANACLASQ